MDDTLMMSRFNILYEESSKFFIHNTLNGAIHEIDRATYEMCTNAQINSRNIKFMPDELISNLMKIGYLVEPSNDIDSINQLRYLKLQKSFQTERLTLVIAPTLFCNFACPYCYEKDLPNNTMSDEVIDDLIGFIKERQNSFKYLELCWHGGEPLVAIKTIEKILNRIKTDLTIEINRHSMVTNGYLINDDFFKCVSHTPLNYIQITIDGNEETHNQNRISKSGRQTFHTIISNIDNLIKKCPDTNIGIRMNVHKNNVNEFIPLYKTLSSRWNNAKVSIYPAFVMDNQSCKVPCFNSVEKTKFLYCLYQQIGKKFSAVDMKLKTGDCTAIYQNSFVVDPAGNLYKCWVDVGVESMSIGNLKTGTQNYKIVEKYLLSSDKFTDKKCLNCKVFPICSGGCNKYRMDEHYTTEDICPISADTIIDFLKIEKSIYTE